MYGYSVGYNITFFRYCLLLGCKRLMCRQHQAIRIVDQRISGNSCYFLISFAESSINNNYFPIAFDRTLTIPLMHRNMSIDDMAGFRIQSKFPYHSIYYFFIFKKMIIRTFCFFVSFLIRNKISFKCSHFILAK